MREWIKNFIQVEVSDPDDARRRRLLNILLVSIAGFAFVGGIVFLVYAGLSVGWEVQEAQLILLSSTIFIAGSLVIMLVNRWSGTLAAFLFLLLLTGAFSFSDLPAELADGRSLFVYTIPIAISSLVLRPAASFIFAALSSLVVTALALSISIAPNFPAIFGFFMLALVSWLSSRSLEQALRDLRTINLELDQRVADRTHELTASLAREVAETSKTQAILESITDGVIVFGTDGRAIVANPAIDRLLGVRPSVMIGLSIEEITAHGVLETEDRQKLYKLLKEPLGEGQSSRLEWGGKALSAIAAPVQDDAGQVLGTVAVFRDFTREAEVERMKNSFIAMVSHELRTPLSAVLAYAEMIRDRVYGPVNEKQSNAAQRIFTNSQRLLTLVSDLLDQAQIEAGTIRIHITSFRPGELVDAMLGIMEKPAQDKGLALACRIEPHMPARLQGDPQRLQQVLVNLVNNAVKFTDSGKISVRFYLPDPDHWALEVADTGPGIPPDAQQYVFDSFRQVNVGDTRNHGGIGLGLSIVKRLVDLMSGEIHLSSAPGQGSTFSAFFPLQPPHQETSYDTADRLHRGR